MARIYIGTSGWQYKHWQGIFYPETLPQNKWLWFYAKHFQSVEVNATFYRLPTKETVKKWQATVPEDFVFSLKAHRFITHIKRLKDCQSPLDRFFASLTPLAQQLPDTSHQTPNSNGHTILWQLPPNLKKNVPRLRHFFKILPDSFRHAFEFRHPSWLDKEVFELFQKQNKLAVAMVLQDWREWPILKEPVGQFVYIRFHGAKRLYTSGYSSKELEEWARLMQEWRREGWDVYAYFNNDALGYAVKNARKLKKLV